MNWGYRILLAYLLFMSMMIYFIFVANAQHNELIEDHYYERELQFQDRLDAKNNLIATKVQPTIEHQLNTIQIKLPNELHETRTAAQLEFIRWSDQSKDWKPATVTFENGVLNIPDINFIEGLYKLRIKWNYNQKDYQFEDSFNFHKL
jgi:hypothetical protein